MSSRVKIKADGCKSLYLDIHPAAVELEAWNQEYPEDTLVMIWFDLKSKEDRKAIKNLISHLQHQLQVGTKDTSKWYNCAHCDAGYPDQECTCKSEE